MVGKWPYLQAETHTIYATLGQSKYTNAKTGYEHTHDDPMLGKYVHKKGVSKNIYMNEHLFVLLNLYIYLIFFKTTFTFSK